MWNPVTGCTKVSPGCAHCYAECLAARLRRMGAAKYARRFEVALHRDALDDPLRWARPRLVFVNSTSDLFHPDVPDAFLEAVLRAMNAASRHTFQVLTKRPERAAALGGKLRWTSNVWLGASVESEPWLRRLEPLRAAPAAVKSLLLEPLLGPLPSLDLAGIDWVIAGGESGPGARPVRARRRAVLLQAVGRHAAPARGTRPQPRSPARARREFPRRPPRPQVSGETPQLGAIPRAQGGGEIRDPVPAGPVRSVRDRLRTDLRALPAPPPSALAGPVRSCAAIRATHPSARQQQPARIRDTGAQIRACDPSRRTAPRTPRACEPQPTATPC